MKEKRGLEKLEGTKTADKDEKSEGGFEKYELEEAVRTLERAAEIKADTKLMAALAPHLDKKVTSLKGMRKLASKVSKDSTEPEPPKAA